MRVCVCACQSPDCIKNFASSHVLTDRSNGHDYLLAATLGGVGLYPAGKDDGLGLCAVTSHAKGDSKIPPKRTYHKLFYFPPINRTAPAHQD